MIILSKDCKQSNLLTQNQKNIVNELFGDNMSKLIERYEDSINELNNKINTQLESDSETKEGLNVYLKLAKKYSDYLVYIINVIEQDAKGDSKN